MLFSKEYVGYLAREITNKLIEGEFIETPNKAAVTERVNTALLEELTLEDRINDEVRIILDTYRTRCSAAAPTTRRCSRRSRTNWCANIRRSYEDQPREDQQAGARRGRFPGRHGQCRFRRRPQQHSPGSAPLAGKPDGAGGQDRRCRPAENRKPAHAPSSKARRSGTSCTASITTRKSRSWGFRKRFSNDQPLALCDLCQGTT